jgi:RNA polymerase sigma-70 factor, ECF subfamily
MAMPRRTAHTATAPPPPHLDDAALTSLIREHEATLLRYVSAMIFNDRLLAEDIVQETLLRAWQRPPLPAGSYQSLRPWLFTVARNLVRDHARARKARPQEVHDEFLLQVRNIDNPIDRLVDVQMIRQALMRLTPAHRGVLVRLYYQRLPFADVATELGIPVGTVKSRANAALTLLRQILTELGAAPAGERVVHHSAVA